MKKIEKLQAEKTTPATKEKPNAARILDDREERVLRCLERSFPEGLTRKEVEERVGGAAAHTLGELVRRGLATRTGLSFFFKPSKDAEKDATPTVVSRAALRPGNASAPEGDPKPALTPAVDSMGPGDALNGQSAAKGSGKGSKAAPKGSKAAPKGSGKNSKGAKSKPAPEPVSEAEAWDFIGPCNWKQVQKCPPAMLTALADLLGVQERAPKKIRAAVWAAVKATREQAAQVREQAPTALETVKDALTQLGEQALMSEEEAERASIQASDLSDVLSLMSGADALVEAEQDQAPAETKQAEQGESEERIQTAVDCMMRLTRQERERVAEILGFVRAPETNQAPESAVEPASAPAAGQVKQAPGDLIEDDALAVLSSLEPCNGACNGAKPSDGPMSSRILPPESEPVCVRAPESAPEQAPCEDEAPMTLGMEAALSVFHNLTQAEREEAMSRMGFVRAPKQS